VLIREYKLRVHQTEQCAIDEAIRTTQFIRNKCVRRWMDTRGIGDKERPRLLLLSWLANLLLWLVSIRRPARRRLIAPGSLLHVSTRIAVRRNPARKAIRASSKTTARLNTKTRVGNWSQMASGSPSRMAWALAQFGSLARGSSRLKRIQWAKSSAFAWSSGLMETHVQFAVQAERQLTHQPTGKQVGIDVGLKAFYTDSEGQQVENPRYLRKAAKRLKRLHRRVSRKVKRSKNRKYASKRLAKGYLKVSRQRKDFAEKRGKCVGEI